VSPSAAAPWRLRVNHHTAYRYSSAVRASYNEVRVVPASAAGQVTLEAAVSTSPAATQYHYRDYWGTTVIAFDVPGAHDHLEIRASALVECAAAAPLARSAWSDLAAVHDQMAEYLGDSPNAIADHEIADLARSLRRGDPTDTVNEVVGWVRASLAYVRGVTGVHTPASEAWRAKSGVCQDFAHLALSALRVVGIPCRYVSGYLHPDPEAAIGADAKGESHAWIEAWTGQWWGIDPTNGVLAGNRHVVVARGRDYVDVPPVKGIFAGGAKAEMLVEVDIRRTG
jgi:transglutaminase-like putative cysteine protease